MITVLLTILKVLGILLLILLVTVVTLLLLVLFVPIRYRISLSRKEEEGIPVSVDVKVTWLLHLVNAAFSYPEAAFLKVRLFCFTLFKSDKKKNPSGGDPDPDEKKKDKKKTERPPETEKISEKREMKKEGTQPEEAPEIQPEAMGQQQEPSGQAEEPERQKFFQKLLSLFQNIRYTIRQICDKIKHIVNNIQYYMNILKSDTFRRAWTVCSGQAFSLLKSILPGKFTGSLVIGTGDPASTGQVLAVYGMLYPLLGNHIIVTPDFGRQIIEGELFVKGKITVFKGLKTAWKIYFNRDLRRVIRLFKREAA